jgi:hypothetical protein
VLRSGPDEGLRVPLLRSEMMVRVGSRAQLVSSMSPEG